jgi:hypothetical protein
LEPHAYGAYSLARTKVAIARQHQRHVLIQAEIDRAFRDAADYPVVMARLNQPL